MFSILTLNESSAPISMQWK